MSDVPSRLAELCAAVAPVDEAARAAAHERSDGQVKPPGSLGRLEALGAQLAAIAGTSPPPVPGRPALLIAAGDHGVHAQGVTPWPQAITAAMVGAFCAGGAAANALADVVGADVRVLDVGVAADLPDHPRLVSAKVAHGTADLTVADPMSAEEVDAAVAAGADAAAALIDDGCDLLVLGDMGIANTTASAALIAACTGASAEVVTGRGTGIDDEMLAHKTEVVATALVRAGAAGATVAAGGSAAATLAALGGLEHAALVGALLTAAGARVPVVLDGVISDAAACVAVAACPAAGGYLVAGHLSVEPGARVALDHLGLAPLVDLDLRLGEGTGALLAVPVVRAAGAALDRMLLLADLQP
ncbi:MAG: nicotinate-nucleotide--dimethylbenzimidazole phosphoribosyltransferase [Actinomycetes bacterium]